MFQTRMSRRAAFVSAVCAAFTLMPSLASATQLIDVEVGTGAAGAGVIGSATDKWNNLNATSWSAVPLTDNGGNSTGVTLTGAAAGGIGGAYANVSPNPSITDYDVWGFPGTPVSMTLSGLHPNVGYTLYAYGLPDTCCSGGRPGTVAAASANGGASALNLGIGTLATWVPGSNYVELAVHANASGHLTFTVSTANGAGETDFNGFQLFTAVPEPASWGMMGLSAMGLLVVGRRLKSVQVGRRGKNVAAV